MKKGLTLSMIFEASSANYGEGIGNISVLKKMSRGDGNMYSYISRQAMRYNIVQQLGWDNTPVADNGVVQFDPKATIAGYPEIDLFGYMKTNAKTENDSGGANTRSAVCRLSNAISLEPYNSDIDYLTNMALAKRGNFKNAIAQSEIHTSFYTYTIAVDLDRVGIDNGIEVDKAERCKRVSSLLDAIQFLYRDIKGRRENLSPVFSIGGVYERKNPYFEGRIALGKGKLDVKKIASVVNSCDDTKSNTVVGYLGGSFINDIEIAELHPLEINALFDAVKKEVGSFYG
jgi:CRISPR-associated protein Cst2